MIKKFLEYKSDEINEITEDDYYYKIPPSVSISTDKINKITSLFNDIQETYVDGTERLYINNKFIIYNITQVEDDYFYIRIHNPDYRIKKHSEYYKCDQFGIVLKLLKKKIKEND